MIRNNNIFLNNIILIHIGTLFYVILKEKVLLMGIELTNK